MVVPVAIPHKKDSRTHQRYGLFRTFSRIPNASGRYFVHCAVSGNTAVLGDGAVVVMILSDMNKAIEQQTTMSQVDDTGCTSNLRYRDTSCLVVPLHFTEN